MQFLDTSERTVYRYLDMLKDLGFKVERDTGNRVWISASGNLDVVPFTPQDAYSGESGPPIPEQSGPVRQNKEWQ